MSFIVKALINKFILNSSDYPSQKESAKEILLSLEKENAEELSINDKLMMIKELKYLYSITKIKPIYFLGLLISCLIIMVFGYFEGFLTCLIGILYPLYFSIKSLRERNKESIRNWLQYWILFSIFLNFEGVFAYFLQDIPLYFFYKVIFLMVCFLPQYNGAKYFYENFIKSAFIEYEKDVYEMTVSLAKRIRTKLMEEENE